MRFHWNCCQQNISQRATGEPRFDRLLHRPLQCAGCNRLQPTPAVGPRFLHNRGALFNRARLAPNSAWRGQEANLVLQHVLAWIVNGEER